MKVLITGACGYVGSRTAAFIRKAVPGSRVFGVDNLSRRGSETSLAPLKKLGVKVFHGDTRVPADLTALPDADWVVDCAANPSVLAGTPSGGASSAQLVGHNLSGTLNLLEYCRLRGSGLLLLSSSRVYSIDALNSIKFRASGDRLRPVLPCGVKGFSSRGVSEEFPTSAPISLYGATKLASEVMALEYSAAFGFPVWIDRCGVIGGPGQFGKADQGVFSFWAYRCALGEPPDYIGFGGRQVRDVMLAEDAAELMLKQMRNPGRRAPRIINVGGGTASSMSLRELNAFCSGYFGKRFRPRLISATRKYDVPYYVSDASLALKHWGWKPRSSAEDIMDSVCGWARSNAGLIRSWLGR